MPVKIPRETYESQINNISNITFVHWVGAFHGGKTLARCKCLIDGFEWNVTPHNLSNGSRCPQCSNMRRWTDSERIDQINNIENVRFVKWGEPFRGARTRVVVQCRDGHEWESSVTSLVNQLKGCPECAEYGYNPSKPGTLYALRSECGTMVKIGISNDHHRRHRELVARTPFAFNCVELCHGDGAMVATLEKVLHGLMEPVVFETPFDGSTEWRKWDARLPEWFDLYRHWS